MYSSSLPFLLWDLANTDGLCLHVPVSSMFAATFRSLSANRLDLFLQRPAQFQQQSLEYDLRPFLSIFHQHFIANIYITHFTIAIERLVCVCMHVASFQSTHDIMETLSTYLCGANTIPRVSLCAIDEKEYGRHMCVNCRYIPVTPFQTNCGCIYCELCRPFSVDSTKKTECHNCKKMILFVNQDINTQQSILEIKIKCHNHTKGCEWTGETGNYEHHITLNCVHQERMCSNCLNVITIQEMDAHLIDCPKKPVQCQRCNHVTYASHINEHWCDFDTVTCSMCSFKTQRWYMTRHFDKCERSWLECPLRDRCQHRCRKNESEKHDMLCLAKNPLLLFQQFGVTKNETYSFDVFVGEMEDIENKAVIIPFSFRNQIDMTFVFFWQSATDFIAIRVLESNTKYLQMSSGLEVNLILLNVKDSSENFQQKMTMAGMSTSMFYIKEFIKFVNLQNNDVTNTCYLNENDWCRFDLVFKFT